MSVSVAEKRAQFRRLHESGCFVIPNPWDLGSARYLQHLGFKALASTSSGFAWSIAKPDNKVRVEQIVSHLSALANGVDVPLNADFEGGFAENLEGLAANVALAVGAGVSGLSIEDSTGDKASPLYEIPRAVERIKAARAAIDRADPAVMLVGRAEGYLWGKPDLKDTIARLTAYADAGADCLYAPGLRTKEDVAAVVKAVAPKPVNVLVGGPTFTVAELADLGVRRISVGGALARTAWGAFMKAAADIFNTGTFGALTSAVPHPEINGFFTQDVERRK
ncbi:MAG TPA: isocitrate lyase/phosphoenolpyruvate mutase family protein [Magnetospirillaceae bacterium]|jgi:methylisocitrate lyase